MIPPTNISWIAGAAQQWFPEVVRLCRESQGALNFHDALIALACQELGVRFLVSFDADFDRLPWLTRMHNVAQIMTLAQERTAED